jgi:hypothetical protein
LSIPLLYNKNGSRIQKQKDKKREFGHQAFGREQPAGDARRVLQGDPEGLIGTGSIS